MLKQMFLYDNVVLLVAFMSVLNYMVVWMLKVVRTSFLYIYCINCQFMRHASKFQAHINITITSSPILEKCLLLAISSTTHQVGTFEQLCLYKYTEVTKHLEVDLVSSILQLQDLHTYIDSALLNRRCYIHLIENVLELKNLMNWNP